MLLHRVTVFDVSIWAIHGGEEEDMLRKQNVTVTTTVNVYDA